MEAKAALFGELSRGTPLATAAIVVVRRLAKVSSLDAAVSFAAALEADPETRTAGRLAGGVTASLRRLPGLALEFFSRVPDELVRTHALDELLEAHYRTHPEGLGTLLTDLLASDAPELEPKSMASVVKFCVVAGESDLAVRGFQRLEQLAAARPAAWPSASREIEWLRPWMTRRVATPVPAGVVSFALLDYRQPSRSKSSQNIGDFIQSLAALGHVVRHQNVRFDGDPELARFASEMQARTRPDRRIHSESKTVSLLAAHRDATSLQSFPEGTWMLAFGWYMHPLFGIRHDFPFNSALRPIFVSVHCNKREMLTPEAIAYLRRYGPIGCRDWTTVDLLLSVGVPAFFSGCLTTTVDTLFQDPPKRRTGGNANVDVPAPASAAVVRHSYSDVKDRTFAENLRESVRLLESYQTASHVTTSRLHCYLPVRSIGVDATFEPKRPADVRFSGLIDIDATAFESIRERILDRLSAVVGAIIDGNTEEQVYDVWRTECADDVAAAQARHSAPITRADTQLDTTVVLRDVANRMVTTGPRPRAESVNVVVPVEVADIEKAVGTVRSMLRHASQPLHVWLLSRACRTKERQYVAAQLPDVSITWLPVGRYARAVGLLLLPQLMSDMRQVVVVPPGSVVNGDIAELGELELAGNALAARLTASRSRSSGFGLLYRAAAKMDATAAHEYYRSIHSKHEFDFDAFETDVLVLDLAQLRKDDLVAEFLPLVESYGFSWNAVLNLYAGPNRMQLPVDWAHEPANEWPYEARLVHWSRGPKPWGLAFAPGQQLWDEVSSHVPQEIERVITDVRASRLTYLQPRHLRDLAAAVIETEVSGRQGLIIEAGTALGGSAIVMAKAKAPGRTLVVYDAFETIPPPTDKDGDDVKKRYAKIAAGKATGIAGDAYYGYREDLLAEVKSSFERFDLPVEKSNVDLVKGYFGDTIHLSEPVALAHLDGDWYESTMTCLERIEPHLVPGGRLIVDDYFKWSGCRRAVDEYFSDREGYIFERPGRLHVVKRQAD